MVDYKVSNLLNSYKPIVSYLIWMNAYGTLLWNFIAVEACSPKSQTAYFPGPEIKPNRVGWLVASSVMLEIFKRLR